MACHVLKIKLFPPPPPVPTFFARLRLEAQKFFGGRSVCVLLRSGLYVNCWRAHGCANRQDCSGSDVNSCRYCFKYLLVTVLSVWRCCLTLFWFTGNKRCRCFSVIHIEYQHFERAFSLGLQYHDQGCKNKNNTFYYNSLEVYDLSLTFLVLAAWSWSRCCTLLRSNV